jgi:hypothetical protein
MFPDGRTHEAMFGAVSNLSLFVAGYALARSFACKPIVSSISGVGLSFVTFMPTPLMWSRVPLQGNYCLVIAGVSIAFSAIVTYLREQSPRLCLLRDITAIAALVVALGTYSLWSFVVLPAWLILGSSLILTYPGRKHNLGHSVKRWFAGLSLIAVTTILMYRLIANSASLTATRYARGVALDLVATRPWFFDDVYPILIPKTAINLYGLVIASCVIGLSSLLTVLGDFSEKLLGRASLASAAFASVYSLTHYGGILQGRELGPSPGYLVLLLFPLWVVAIASGGRACLQFARRWYGGAQSQSSEMTDRPSRTGTVVTPSSLLVVLLLLWLTVWMVDNAALRNSRSFYPVKPSEVSEFLQERQTKQPTGSFSGRTMLLQREDSERDGKRNSLLYPTPFTKKLLDELVELRVPVLNAHSHLLSARFVEATSRWFANDRPFVRPWTSFEGFYPKLARMLGVRYVITESDTKVDGGLELLVHSGPISVFELSEPNLGQYSPTQTVAESTIKDVVGFMKSASFNPLQMAITNVPLQALVSAENVSVVAERGLISVKVKTKGRSLLVLPFEYTNCMQLIKSETVASLDRVNYFLTGLLVQGSGTFQIEVQQNPFLGDSCD